MCFTELIKIDRETASRICLQESAPFGFSFPERRWRQWCILLQVGDAMSNNDCVIIIPWERKTTATCYGATLWPTSAIGSSTIVKVYRGGSYGLSSSCRYSSVRPSLSLSLSFSRTQHIHAFRPSHALRRLSVCRTSISTSLRSRLSLPQTSRIWLLEYVYTYRTHAHQPPPQNIIRFYAVALVAARVRFYRPLRNTI